MKNFIEVTVQNGEKAFVNVNTISYISLESKKTKIVLLPQGENKSRYIIVTESYEEVKSLIQEAL